MAKCPMDHDGQVPHGPWLLSCTLWKDTMRRRHLSTTLVAVVMAAVAMEGAGKRAVGVQGPHAALAHDKMR